MRLIDADAIIWHNESDFGTPDERWYPESDIKRMIDTRPTIETEPVRHGHWVETTDRIQHECSVCHICVCGSYGNYCSNCGAKMDGDEE